MPNKLNAAALNARLLALSVADEKQRPILATLLGPTVIVAGSCAAVQALRNRRHINICSLEAEFPSIVHYQPLKISTTDQQEDVSSRTLRLCTQRMTISFGLIRPMKQ